MEVEKIKQVMRKKPKISDRIYLSTGSTLVNLAITGKHNCGFGQGTYVLFVGDTQSGKTWLALSCFAEASIDSRFDEYELIYDNAENGAMMDIEYYFGSKVAQRIRAPRMAKGRPVYSYFIEDFYFNLDDALDSGKKFIYVLDSIDSLTSKPEEKKFDENKKASRSEKEKELKGDYGDGKAKVSSRNMRLMMRRLEDSGSILVVINQTRDNPAAGLFEPKKVRSGGRALEFYAHVELWSSVAGTVKRTVRGKEREVGIESRVRVVKNRSTGRRRDVVVPILHSVGVDDIGSCVDYLVTEKEWSRDKGGAITATGIGPEICAKREQLIQEIEQRELEPDVVYLVQQTWNEIEEACKVTRKSRYR